MKDRPAGGEGKPGPAAADGGNIVRARDIFVHVVRGSTMQTIATFAKPEDAHMLRARLEGSGVPAFIRDEHTIALYWFYSQAIGGVKVEVDDDDAERAREILALPPSEPGVITCPLCGSENVRARELNFWAGLLMFLGTVLPIHSRRADCLACRRSFKATDGIMKMPGASPAQPPASAP